MHIVKTLYKVGEMVYPDSFNEDRWNECSNGIHFFINKQDAISELLVVVSIDFNLLSMSQTFFQELD